VSHIRRSTAEIGVGRGAEQRLELGLVQEADVGVGRAYARLVDELARIGRSPAAPLAELEDRVQQPEVVEDALRRAALAALGADERLDVTGLDAVQRLEAEERREVDAQVRLVVHQRRALAPDAREVVEVAAARVLDGGTLVRRSRRALCFDAPSKLCFGLRLGHAAALPRAPLLAELALDDRVAGAPLAVPRLAAGGVDADEERSGSVRALGHVDHDRAFSGGRLSICAIHASIAARR